MALIRDDLRAPSDARAKKMDRDSEQNAESDRLNQSRARGQNACDIHGHEVWVFREALQVLIAPKAARTEVSAPFRSLVVEAMKVVHPGSG